MDAAFSPFSQLRGLFSCAHRKQPPTARSQTRASLLIIEAMGKKTAPENILYYGDNLKVLRQHVPDKSVDLVYLDPPFNSNADYNVLFAEKDGSQAAAQIKVFGDTWKWDIASAGAYQEIVEAGGRVSQAMQAFRGLVGTNDMLAYLSMMAPRLVELKRVLKDNGSLYLHCDPTASHYLKILLDAVFGLKNFRNEITWRRTGAHNKAGRYAPIHDTILYYSKSLPCIWNHPKRPYMNGHVEEHFVKEGNRWRTNYYGNVLTGSGTRTGESGTPWQGFDPTAKGRHWAIPGALIDDLDEDFSDMTQRQKLDRLLELGHITITPGEAWPMYQRYITPRDGTPVPDLWAFQPYTGGTVFGTDEGVDEDVRWLSTRDQERLGYPTQKPETLLDRIIRASSNEGDTVLDPFCGCGTTIAAAQKMKRRWIGIDITHLAIALIKNRMHTTFGNQMAETYAVVGEPEDLASAQQLAGEDPYQFQWWALSLVNARPVDEKKGADKGIDGRLYFHDDLKTAATKQIIFSVKAGNTGPTHVRDLRGVVEREKAAIGVMITMHEPTAAMKSEAADGGFYNAPGLGPMKHPRLQLLTIEQLLGGAKVDFPGFSQNLTFKAAPKVKEETHQNQLWEGPFPKKPGRRNK